MKLRTRIMALFLTVLMVAGLLPMSIFAIDAKAGGSPADHTGKEWNSANAIKETLDEHFQIDYETTIGSIVTAAHEGGKAPTYTEGKGYILEKGANNYVDFRMTGYNGGSTVISNLGDKGGRDFVISFDFALPEDTPDLSTLTGHLYNMMGINFRKSDNKDTAIGGFAVNRGNLNLYGIDNKSAWSAGPVARLKRGENVRFYFYFDFGGPREDCGNTAYYLAYDKDGILLGFQQFTVLSDSALDVIYNETAKTGYTQQGFLLTHVRFNNNNSNYGIQVDNLSVHYSKNTKSEKNFIDLESRSMGIYYDFDDLTVGNYYDDGGKTKAKYYGQTGLNMANKNNDGFLAVSDGNGGAALQLNPKGGAKPNDRYVNVSSPFAAGKKFSFSVDVKSGDAMVGTSLIQFIDRDSNEMYKNYSTAAWYTALDADTKAKVAEIIGTANKSMVNSAVVWVGADKTIGYGYYASDTATATTNSAAVGSINDDVFTNIELVYDGATNLCWMYVNGVLVSPEAGFMALHPKWHYVLKLSHGGTKAGEFRLYQSTHAGNAVTFDNIAMYNIDGNGEHITNKVPLEGVKKDADGYVRYYENGHVVPNYKSETAAFTTDDGGVIIKKDRYSFIDWEGTAAGGENKEMVTYSKMGSGGVKAYADALFGSALAANMKIHYNNHLSRNSGGVWFTLDKTSSVFSEKTFDICNTATGEKTGTRTDKVIDLTTFDEIQMDIYTDQVYQYLFYLRLESVSDLYGRVANKYNTNHQIGFNLGTTGYYPNGKDKDNKDRKYTEMGDGFEVDGWQSISVKVDSLVPAPVGKGSTAWEYSLQHINSFALSNSAWGCLDGKWDANGDAMYNTVESPMFFRDIYLVKWTRLTEISQVEDLYEQVGNGDFVPKDFTGKFVAKSGNEYFYTVYDHKRVTDTAYFDTEMSGETVTGYSADDYGVLTPVNGKFVNRGSTVRYSAGGSNRDYSRRDTYIYVNGVIQKGTVANDYSVTYNGVKYAVNAAGEVVGDYMGMPVTTTTSTSVATYVKDGNFIKGSDFSTLTAGKDQRNFFLGSGIGYSPDGFGFSYASNSTTGNTIFNVNNGPAKATAGRDIAMQFGYYGNSGNPYFNSTKAFTGDTVLEFDIMIDDDWNARLNTYNREEGKGWTLFINPDATITVSDYNYPLAKLEYGEWYKIAIASHITPNGDKYKYTYDIYLNGVKIAADIESTAQSGAGKGNLDFWRCFAFESDANANNGTYTVDNWFHYKGSAPAGVSTATLNGVYGNRYYENGTNVKSRLIDLGNGKYLYAWSNGTLAYNTSYEIDGALYTFDGYYGTKVTKDGVQDGYLIKDLKVVNTEGIHEVDGKKYYIGADGNLLKDTTVSAGDVWYTVNGYYATAITADGVYNGKLFKNGAPVTTVGIHYVNNDYYYVNNASGTVTVDGLVEVDNVRYYTSDHDGRIYAAQTLVVGDVINDDYLVSILGGSEYDYNNDYGADSEYVLNESTMQTGINITDKSYLDLRGYDKFFIDMHSEAQTKSTAVFKLGMLIGYEERWYEVTGLEEYTVVSGKVYKVQDGENVSAAAADIKKLVKFDNKKYTSVKPGNEVKDSTGANIRGLEITTAEGVKIGGGSDGRLFHGSDGKFYVRFYSYASSKYTYSNANNEFAQEKWTTISYNLPNASTFLSAIGMIRFPASWGFGGDFGNAGKTDWTGDIKYANLRVAKFDTTYYSEADFARIMSGELKGGWNGEVGSSSYADPITHTLLTGIQVIDGVWYSFDENGVCNGALNGIHNVKHYNAENKVTTANKYFINGAMQYGFFKGVDGAWYYADTTTGELTKSANKITLNIPYYDVVAESANRIVNINDYVVTILDDFYAPDETFYENGILMEATGIYTADDGKKYYVAADGKVQKTGTVTVGEDVYDIEDYVAKVRHDNVIYGKYYWNSVMMIGKIDKTTCPGATYFGDDQILYAGEDGMLYVDGVTCVEGVWYKFVGDKGEIANGIEKFDYADDGELGENARYFVNGVLRMDLFTENENIYITDSFGNLLVGQQTASDGKTYDCDAESYVATVRNGIIADENADNADKYYVDGMVQYGFYTIGDKIYLTDEDGKLLTGKQIVEADEDRVYDFDAESYEGTMRDNYVVVENLYWIDGYTAEHIHFVGEDEMYFVGGAPTAGEIPCEDGTVHVFGEDGKRVVEEGEEEAEDKAPLNITIILQTKNPDGTFSKLNERTFYQFWNTDFEYVAPYNGCYVISIELKKTAEDEVEVHDHDIIIHAVQHDYEIVVTYDTTVAKVHEFVLENIKPATCKEAGTEYYVCAHCDAEKEETIEIDADAHKYAVDVTPSTCITNGKVVTTCEYCGDSSTVYLEKKAHTWAEDHENDVEPTCGKSGKKAYICTVEGCGATKKVTVAATGEHDWDTANAVIKQPTCSNKGQIKVTCTVCGKTQVTSINATGMHVHDEDDEPIEVLINAADGSQTKIYNCAVCGKEGAVTVYVPVTPAPVLPGDDDDDLTV